MIIVQIVIGVRLLTFTNLRSDALLRLRLLLMVVTVTTFCLSLLLVITLLVTLCLMSGILRPCAGVVPQATLTAELLKSIDIDSYFYRFKPLPLEVGNSLLMASFPFFPGALQLITVISDFHQPIPLLPCIRSHGHDYC